MTAGRLDPSGVWDLEDEEALAAARSVIEQYSEIEPMVADQAMAADSNGTRRPEEQM